MKRLAALLAALALGLLGPHQVPTAAPRPAAIRYARILERFPTVPVLGPTLIALTPLAPGEPPPSPPVPGLAPAQLAARFRAAAALADSLGYAFAVRYGPGLTLHDPSAQAIYYPVRYPLAGFLLAMPGRRPRLIPGLVDTATLRAEIRRYHDLVQPLV